MMDHKTDHMVLASNKHLLTFLECCRIMTDSVHISYELMKATPVTFQRWRQDPKLAMPTTLGLWHRSEVRESISA